MLNQVTLIGRLGDTPDLRYTGQGTAVCNFSIAVERDFTNSQGEKEVDWIDIVVWRKQADNCANYIDKGNLVAVTGRLQVRKWQNDNGDNRYSTEVVANNVRFLEWKDNNKNNNTKEEPEIEVPF